MKKLIRYLAIAFCFFTSFSIYAIELDTAKADGLVGERADGYLAAVNPSASAEIRALIDDVNAKREAQYQRIAQKNGIPIEDVEVLAGKKTIEMTESGGWVFIDEWRQK